MVSGRRASDILQILDRILVDFLLPVPVEHGLDLGEDLLLDVGVEGEVVEGPAQEVARGVEAAHDERDGLRDGVLGVRSVVEDRVEQWRDRVIARVPFIGGQKKVCGVCFETS